MHGSTLHSTQNCLIRRIASYIIQYTEWYQTQNCIMHVRIIASYAELHHMRNNLRVLAFVLSTHSTQQRGTAHYSVIRTECGESANCKLTTFDVIWRAVLALAGSPGQRYPCRDALVLGLQGGEQGKGRSLSQPIQRACWTLDPWA